jgi:hypothetical protein
MSHDQPEKKSHRERNIYAAIILIAIAFVALYYSGLSSPAVHTSTSIFLPPAFQPGPFYWTTAKPCLYHNTTTYQNMTIRYNLYLIHINVTTNLSSPVVYQNVSVHFESANLSTGMLILPALKTKYLPRSWWTAQGLDLSLRVYVPENASTFGYPHATLTGVYLTVNVLVLMPDQTEPQWVAVSPEVSLSLINVQDCSNSSS